MEDNRNMNKEQILQRMQKGVAKTLDVSRPELLDPIVNLFLESLSEEVFKIAGEIDSIEERILNKISSILAPTIDTIAHPAHCILHAAALKAITDITTLTEFQHQISSDKFSFYPVNNTKIYPGKVSSFIHKGQVSNIGQHPSKTDSIKSSHPNSFEDNALWIGLKLDESVKDISGLSIYFDIHTTYDNKEQYLNLLSYAEWSLEGEKIEMRKGAHSQKREYESSTLELFAQYDLSTKIDQWVMRQYNHHYLTISKECSIVDKRTLIPTELTDYFTEESLDSAEPLVWIKAICPPDMINIIDSLRPCINTFPIINKELISKVAEVSKTVPIIPINTNRNQSFLCIEEVSDESNKRYYDIPVNDTKHNSGTYGLRRGGIERYNKRDASEYLTNIVDSLDNSASTFFNKNSNDASSNLKIIEKEVNKLVTDLKKRQADINEWYEVENYLLAYPNRDQETYFISYWITNGEEPNQIRSGSRFTLFSDLQIDHNSVYSLSVTRGGSYPPMGDKKKNLYKNSLSKHNLLITNEDIVDFCLKEFKESICEVTVRKGFMENDSNLGFTEVTNVFLTPTNNMKDLINEKDRELFHKALVDNSPGTFKYRVFF